MVDNYLRILEKISKISGVEKEELERRVEAKRAKLAGLISYEGAAQVIAAELGINFEDEKLKINELLPGMRKVHVSGKVIWLSPVRTFTTKKGDEGKVVNLNKLSSGKTYEKFDYCLIEFECLIIRDCRKSGEIGTF